MLRPSWNPGCLQYGAAESKDDISYEYALGRTPSILRRRTNSWTVLSLASPTRPIEVETEIARPVGQMRPTGRITSQENDTGRLAGSSNEQSTTILKRVAFVQAQDNRPVIRYRRSCRSTSRQRSPRAMCRWIAHDKKMRSSRCSPSSLVR